MAAAVWGPALLAQDRVAPPSDYASGITPAGYGSEAAGAEFSRLLDWESWLSRCLTQMESDSLAEAAVSAESCLAKARVLDIHLPAFARKLSAKANELEGQGRAELAQRFSGLALEANPTNLANIIGPLKNRRVGAGQAVQQVGQALKHFRPWLKAAGHITLWASLLMGAWGAIFLFYAAVRRVPRIVHFLSEYLSPQIPPKLRAIFAGCFLLALIIAAGSFSLPLAAMALAAWAAAFAATKERMLLAASVLMVAAASVGLSLGHRMMWAAGDGYLTLLEQANHSPWSRRLDAELARSQERRPQDLKPAFAMALLAGRSGRHQLASQRYLMILGSRPGNAPALNNLGNIQFRLARYDSARALYEGALAADPSLAVAHYNLGQVHMHSLRFPEGKRELEKASALDPGQVDDRASRSGGGVVLDALLTKRLLWMNVWPGWNILEGFSRAEVETLSGPRTWLPAAGGLAMFALFIAALFLWGKPRPDGCCESCGTPVCPRCGGEDGRFCPPCAAKIYAAQSPDIQEKLIKSLRPLGARRRMMVAAASNLLVPGSVWVVEGRLMAGWLWALLWGLTYATWRCWVLGLHPARAMQQLGIGWWPLAALAVILYLSSWLPVVTRKD